MAVVGVIRIEGASELERKLKQLEPKMSRKIVRKALRAGARPIQQQEKANIPAVANREHPAGVWKRSIKIRSAKRSRRGDIGIVIQSRQEDFEGENFYGPFVELGHKTGRRGSPMRRQVPGKHYIRKAFETKKGAATAIISRELAAGIEAVARERT